MDSTIVAIDELGGFVLERFARPLMRVIKELGTCLVVLDTVVDVAVLDENARVPVNAHAKKSPWSAMQKLWGDDFGHGSPIQS